MIGCIRQGMWRQCATLAYIANAIGRSNNAGRRLESKAPRNITAKKKKKKRRMEEKKEENGRRRLKAETDCTGKLTIIYKINLENHWAHFSVHIPR